MIDVSMNAHAVCVEKLLQLNVLGLFQAVNSFGSLSGVLIGGLFSAYGIPPFVHFVLVCMAFASFSLFFFHFLINDEHEKVQLINITKMTLSNSVLFPTLKTFLCSNADNSSQIVEQLPALDKGGESDNGYNSINETAMEREGKDESVELCGYHKPMVSELDIE